MAPNLIILMADQLRYDFVTPELAPRISRLIGESVAFTRAYCASPLCVPARGSFYTGRYPNDTGSIINPWEPRDGEAGNVRAGIPTLYELMEHEWESVHAGKQHLFTAPTKLDLRPDSPTAFAATDKTYGEEMREAGLPGPGGNPFRGVFPEMAGGRTTRARRYSAPATGVYPHGYDRMPDAHFTRAALNAIREHDNGKPLLLNLTFTAPHPPYHVPEPFYSRHGAMELPENVGHWYHGQSPLQLYNYPGAVGTRLRRDQWEAVWPVYAGLVSMLDHCVGQVLDALAERGIYDDSLIVFTCDHGEMLGSHMLWQKMCMYEESVRTPISFKLPRGALGAGDPGSAAGSGGSAAGGGGQAARTVGTRVSAIDFLPTFCELCGIATPAGVTGRSLVPLLRGDKAAARAFDERPIFIQFDGNGALGNFQRCVLHGRHKLIVDLFKDETFLELYDVETDPMETTNLAFDPGSEAVVDSLLELIRGYMKESGDHLPAVTTSCAMFREIYGPFHREGTLI